MVGISTVHFVVRLWLAIGMGALVGLERQWRQRMAGTRTNALVAAGAAAFVMCGFLLDNDPSARGRIVSYVVSGVGFLGAGVIFKEGGNVRGLNTAAHIRGLLLSTITQLPVTLQAIHGEQDDEHNQDHIRAEMTTAGRNNEAIEQVVMRLSTEDDVSTLSWSIVEQQIE